MTTRHGLLFCVTLVAGIAFAVPVYAQLNPAFDADLSLELSPLHPRPGETVKVSARSTLIDLSHAALEWLENGQVIAGGIGVTGLDVVAGPLGTESLITAALLEDGIERTSASARIHPTELDLLWESDSYVPPLYRGRSLPSAGTNIILEAIPRFQRPNGTLVPREDITFTWRKNEYVVQSISGRGRAQVVIEAPSLFGVDTIRVDARTADGLFENSASVRIPSIEPRIVLYEDHPLFGVLYHDAIPQRSFRPDIEVSFAAVPYFAEALDPNDPRLLYEWRVNGNTVGSNLERPNTLTVNARGSSGLAQLELALSHATNLFLNTFGSWAITLASSESGANPFTNTPQ